MRRVLPALLIATAVVGAAAAQAQIVQAILGATKHGGGGGFTGIGDVSATGVIGHYGSVAFKASTRGSKMYRICDVVDWGCSGGTAKDISSDATTGLVSSTQGVGTIATCGTGANTCFINKAYDDSGAGVDIAPFGTNSPPFIPNAIGTLPAMGCLADNSTRLYANGFATTAGATYVLMTFNTNGSIGSLFSPYGSADVHLYLHNGAADIVWKRDPTSFSTSFTPTPGTNYAFIAGDDGATNGHVFVDGTDHTGTVGTNTTNDIYTWCGQPVWAGFSTEFAAYNANLASVAGSMNTVIHTNNGF